MKHFLTVNVPDQKPVKYALKGSLITVGRGADNAITLAVPEVSSHHLEFRADDTGYQVVDVGSTNGTTINEQKITEHQLAPGDELIIGLVVRAAYSAIADEAAAAEPAAEPLKPQVVEDSPEPVSPTVVLKQTPAAAGANASAPSDSPAPTVMMKKTPKPSAGASPAKPAQEEDPPTVVAARKMVPPGAEQAEEEDIPVAKAVEPEEEEQPKGPKLAVPKPEQKGGGPKKLNFG